MRSEEWLEDLLAVTIVNPLAIVNDMQGHPALAAGILHQQTDTSRHAL